MLIESKFDFKPLLALIAVNLIYLFLIIIDAVEAVFSVWIIFLFLSLLPLMIKDNKNIIVIIVFLMPLEISKTFIPFLQTIEVTEGFYNSVFDLARLFMLYSFIVWFLKDRRSLIPVIRNKISYLLLTYIVFYLLSALIISPDMSKGLIEAFRYLIYFMLFTMVGQFVEKPEDFKYILKALILIGVILSIVGILEYVFDYHVWDPRIWEDKGRRAAATYFDPNIFARFLNIVICTSLILRLKKIYIIKPQYLDIALLLSSIALFFTVSRQGIFILFATIFIISFFLEKKQRNAIWIGMAAISIVVIPVFIYLMSLRDQGLAFYDIGTRAGLILGGVLMFISSPIYGVGAGGFQTIMIDRYLDYLPWGIHSATLSHTGIVTVLAELGIIGLTLLLLLFYFMYKQFKRNYSITDNNLKAYALIVLSGLIIVIIGAQAEGRFFSEPLLWLFLGLGMAIEKINKKRNEEKKT